MALGQTRRSGLRKSLQISFVNGVRDLLLGAHKNGSLENRFSASWKWMIAIMAMKQQRFDPVNTNVSFKEAAHRLGIFGYEGVHPHQPLFNSPCMMSMPERAISSAFDHLSDEVILKQVTSEYRDDLVDPWGYVLPEDIGSCYELMRELEAIEINGQLDLIQKGDRRKAGVHHTPFDVTQHIVNLSLEKIGASDESVPEDLVICDLSVGAGAFLLQFARVLSNISNTDVGVFLEKNLIGFDIDEEVLFVSSLCFHLERGCPQFPTSYNLHHVDSVGSIDSREKIKSRIKLLMPKSHGTATITTGNPPYVRVKMKEFANLGYQTVRCRNLSAFFVEQAIEITEIGGVVSQILPLSLIDSYSMKSFRSVLEGRCSSIDIESYDCVPGYIFDQGKIGSNTNKAITQRAAIITARTGESDLTRVRATRLIRWGSRERDHLFENVSKVEIPGDLRTDHRFPKIGDEETLSVFKKIIAHPRTMEDLLCEDSPMKLFVPKAIRYFTTASRDDLRRAQTVISFKDILSRNLAQVLINSSYFYWFWRIFGNGFQVSKRNLYSLPIPSRIRVQSSEEGIAEMCSLLEEKKHLLTVTKQNNRPIKNIKYDKDPVLMDGLDSLVCSLFEIDKSFAFHASKQKTLQAFDSINR